MTAPPSIINTLKVLGGAIRDIWQLVLLQLALYQVSIVCALEITVSCVPQNHLPFSQVLFGLYRYSFRDMG
ncbi:hypothetical protein BGX38DRAFT_1182372 [Terfezia claveryi]|nr:hypothetical protein BGX38DRAFT_1182372 [Terfezia claveryi]